LSRTFLKPFEPFVKPFAQRLRVEAEARAGEAAKGKQDAEGHARLEGEAREALQVWRERERARESERESV
jgi:hypothetical protein